LKPRRIRIAYYRIVMSTLRNTIIANFCDDEHDIERVLGPIEKDPYKYANGSIKTKPMLRDYAFELVEKSHKRILATQQEQIAALQEQIAALQKIRESSESSVSDSESESSVSDSESESSESSVSDSESSESSVSDSESESEPAERSLVPITLNTRRCGRCGEQGHYRNNCPLLTCLPKKKTTMWNISHIDKCVMKYICPQCGKQEMNKSNLDRHKKNKHPNDIPN
jgi:predicted RNA-binding Zn-ribbon protein involved in translation (DUF1610 family)